MTTGGSVEGEGSNLAPLPLFKAGQECKKRSIEKESTESDVEKIPETDQHSE